jgi:hypothetical protein
MEQFFSQYKDAITVFTKIIVSIVVAVLGGKLFVSFMYNFSLKYFENLSNEIKGIKSDLKILFERTDNHEAVNKCIDFCDKKNKFWIAEAIVTKKSFKKIKKNG